MIIKRIELTNWGPHKSLKVNLLANVVGIIGGNGHGKSNFLQAIDYGLNGNLNKQNKELYIYNFGKEDGATKATVKIEFNKNGAEGVITRSITKTSSTRKLEWEGKVFTSDADVSAQMTRILGADKAAMANAIFIKQGCLGALVKGTPAERLSIFQKLMNLSFLDSRDNDIKNKIDKLKQGITDYRPSITIIAGQIRDIREEISTIKDSIPEDPSNVLNILKRLNDKIKRLADTRLAANVARGKFTDAKVKYDQMLKDSKTNSLDSITRDLHAKRQALLDIYNLKGRAERLEDISNKIITTSRELQETTDKLEKAESSRRSDEEIESIKATLTKLEGHIEELKKKRNNEINKELIESDLAEASEELKDKRALFDKVSNDFINTASSIDETIEKTSYDLGATKLKLEYLENLGFGQEDGCPICGNKVVKFEGEALSKEIAETKEREEAAAALLDRLKSKRENLHASYRNVQCDLASITQKVDTLQKDLESVCISLSSLNLLKEFPDELFDAERLASNLNSTIYSQKFCIEKIEQLREQKEKLDNILSAAQKEELELKAKKLKSAKEYDDEATSLKIEIDAKYSTYSELRRTHENVDCLEAVYKHNVEESQRLEVDLENDFNSTNIVDAVDELNTDTIAELIDKYEGYNSDFVEKTAQYTSKLEILSQLIEKRNDLVNKAAVEEERLQLIDDLNKVRELTNKNGLPLAYMNSIFDKITLSVQDMLSKMGANFTVFKDELRPCTFKFMRTDNNTGYTMPQEMLSGGQAIRLSLALLIACQRLILPEVGMLVLDEPSSHMDAEGVESLKELFIQMASIFHSSETQLIAVDHNEILETAFEKVITL